MSDFKFGTWYPIETAPKNKQLFDVWVPSRRMSFRVGRWPGFSSPASDSVEFWTKEVSGEPATHWMPPPPSPEEMAAKPSLEFLLREHIGCCTNNVTANRLRQILKEAGLE